MSSLYRYYPHFIRSFNPLIQYELARPIVRTQVLKQYKALLRWGGSRVLRSILSFAEKTTSLILTMNLTKDEGRRKGQGTNSNKHTHIMRRVSLSLNCHLCRVSG